MSRQHVDHNKLLAELAEMRNENRKLREEFTRLQESHARLKAASQIGEPNTPDATSAGGAERVLDTDEELRRLNSELTRRNAELEIERTRWKQVVEGIADEVRVCDTAGRMSLVNLPAVSHMGLEEFQDKSLEQVLEETEILSPDGQPRPKEQSPLLRSLKGEVVRGEEIMRHRRTGRTRWRQYSSAPIRDATGSIVGSVAVLRDITEQKQAEEELRRANALLQAINESTPTLIYVKDLDGRMVYANAASLAVLGREESEVIGHDDWDYLPAEIAASNHVNDRKVIDGGVTQVFEEVTETHLGRRVWLSAKTPYRDDKGKIKGLVAVSLDSTTQKEAEKARERMLAAEQEARTTAEEAVRLRDEFITIAAHELRTPVTALQGYSQLIAMELRRRGGVEPGMLVRSVRHIEQQSKRLTRLSEQLLSLSRLRTGRMVLSFEVVDLVSLLKNSIAAVKQSYPEREFVLRGATPTPITIDPVRIDQVFTNLLDNAAKFSPPDSQVEVDVHVADHGWVEVSVRDYGIGVAEENRDRIFERFYQAHDNQRYGGMGIGLFVSRQIVEMHGGTVMVEQPEGEGTRFVVRLSGERPSETDGQE